MSHPKIPTGHLDESKTLELLQSIETRGGSVAFKRDPTLFQDVIDQINATKTREEVVIDRLQEAKLISPKEYEGQITVVKEWAADHSDEEVQKLIPLFDKLQVNPDDGSTLDTLKNKIGIISNERRYGEDCKRRILEFLEAFEGLGGSEGYKKHIESTHPPAAATQKEAVDSDGYTWVSASGWIVSTWIIDWMAVHTADSHKGSGYVWGVGLGYMGFWGSLGHLPWDKMMSATNSVFFYTLTVGIEFTVFDFYISGSQVAALNTISAGVLLGIGFSGSINWVTE
ncbi:hypothetical protein HYPSUDRAFT_39636 [Hypholoma sublateritium FD-334 SS-4]|uniref:Uncharacterized protein n=1 Tax=Hypholoma sublateritium (strain FD-334 SS-4) TaxID=945553 RepID=A0A0D2PWC9_HYPSF|nr:hypothetical protein HYPSUDRAFT_39636 [Hypholoma sublateritium FD-334 SS-4]